jgi:uncharacterized alpha-E superfamily protein
VISRVADHCLWFGRYMERAESTARLLQATRTLVLDADVPVTRCWQPLVIVSGEHPQFVERHGADAEGDGEVVQRYMTWDERNLVSLRSSIRAARDSARNIRDVLSLEVWEEVNELYLWLEAPEAKRLFDDDREQFFRRVRRGTQLVLGVVRSTMLHDTPMAFLWLGVMLERVGQTARILDMHHHTMEQEAAAEESAPARGGEREGAGEAQQIVEVALWLSLLRACSGYESFVKKAQGRVTAPGVVSFLLFDAQFPRSLRYCVRSAHRIIGDVWPPETSGARASLARLQALSRWLDQQEPSFKPAGIHALLTHVVDETAQICSDVGREILGPPAPARMRLPAQAVQ